MTILNEREMQGFLRGLPSHLTSKQRRQAILDHFFTVAVFHEFPKEMGHQYAENLTTFLDLDNACFIVDAEKAERCQFENTESD